MAISLVAGIVAIIKGLDGVVGEYWTRYFLLLAFLGTSNVIGNHTGLYVLEGLISFVISQFVSGFTFPIYSGWSSLFILAASMPLINYLIHTTVND